MIVPKHIIISRTDSIGDVVLTLPMAGVLKSYFPEVKITFLAQKYTEHVIRCSSDVDEVFCWDEIKKQNDVVTLFKKLNADTIIHVFPNKEIAAVAKRAKIKYRIATARRWYNLIYCNKLLNYTRKNSDLHEAELNLKLLKPLGIEELPSLSDLPNYYHVKSKEILSYPEVFKLIDSSKFNLILHPCSKGSAREWGFDNFNHLIELLPAEKFTIFISGTADDKKKFSGKINTQKSNVHDISGQLNLNEFISFIDHCDGLLAASTGPLHIAAMLEKHALGIYAPMRPIHPGRWSPIGKKTKVFVLDKNCNDCRKTSNCACIKAIQANEVASYLKLIS
jgi:ADP-heptose:LPS heptosyltransferase